MQFLLIPHRYRDLAHAVPLYIRVAPVDAQSETCEDMCCYGERDQEGFKESGLVVWACEQEVGLRGGYGARYERN